MLIKTQHVGLFMILIETVTYAVHHGSKCKCTSEPLLEFVQAGFAMLVVQFLRGAVKHAGSRHQCRAEGWISAARGISSSSQQLSDPGRSQVSSCADTDGPKVLITGRCDGFIPLTESSQMFLYLQVFHLHLSL